MAQAPRDQNRVTTLLGVSSADGTTPVTLYADPTTHRLLTSASGGAAPSDATYVVISANASLTDERVLTGTANQITITDNGAGSTVVLSLPQSIATSSTPTFASMTLTAASSLTLGTASTNTGAIILKNSTNGNNTTIQAGAAGASLVFTLPTDDGDANEVLTSNGSGVLSWEPVTSLGGANTALSNLASVAINTALLPDAAAADDFGSATLPFKDIFLAGSSGTPGTNNFRLTGASTSGTRVVTLFDATDTVVGKATTDTFTNKTFDTAGSGNSFSINGTAISAVTGTGAVVLATSPALTTPNIGAATATSVNGLTITSSTGTFTLTNGKTLAVTNTLTLSGTDGTTMTFPTTTATIARTDAAQTFTGVQTLSSSPVLSSGAVTVSGNTVTFPTTADTLVARATTDTLTNKRITARVSTEASSATPTINTDNVDAHSITALATAITSMTTNLSGTPTNFQKLTIRILDNGTGRAITWGAAFEDRGVALPTTTTANKLLTVGFIYDTVDSIWGCVAVADET